MVLFLLLRITGLSVENSDLHMVELRRIVRNILTRIDGNQRGFINGRVVFEFKEKETDQ